MNQYFVSTQLVHGEYVYFHLNHIIINGLRVICISSNKEIIAGELG